ncbi:cupin domain-containing protein [Stagonosporopsis vannaccii]|nr:cupin domain-containing protein [Stagonosporopsis vannaccii]
MPGEVKVKKSSEITSPSGPQSDGMERIPAIVDMSDQICGTVMLAKPHSASAIHHHGEEDTIVYAVSGRGAIVSENGKKRQELAPGDFALIPAYAEHQEVNDGDEEVKWIITRGGRDPIVHNLDGWGKSQDPEKAEGAY